MNLETSLAGMIARDAEGQALAHCAPFHVGPIEVVPARRELRAQGRECTIQPLPMRVLLALAEAHPGTCSREDLIRECWGQRIVGDDALHRVISTLRRDLAELSAASVKIETIPKVGYRLSVGDAHGGGAAARWQWSRSKTLWSAVSLLVLALVSAGFLRSSPASADVTAVTVIADSAGAGAETQRFADSLTGDLARLASAMPEVAFVEPSGDKAAEPLLLRVALDQEAAIPTARVRLVDRKAGAVVWSHEFVAEGGTTAELRELAANGIAGVVQCGLDRSVMFDDPVGLRLHLNACDALEVGDFERARAFSQQITKVRPEMTAGWSCLANSMILNEARKGSVSKAVLDEAAIYARRAQANEPNSGLAYVAMAMVAAWRGEPVLEILERGLRVDPDFVKLLKHYSLALSNAGMTSKAVEPALRAVALHPHDSDAYQIAVAALTDAGRTSEAIALLEKMQQKWRYDRGVRMQRLSMLLYASEPSAALGDFASHPLRAETRVASIYQSLLWRSDPKGYDWSGFDRMARQSYAGNSSSAWKFAAMAARMGDEARAHEWLARAPDAAFFSRPFIFARDAAALRRDPKFFAKMASVGLVAYWQRSGRWPDFCSEPGLTYDCRELARSLSRQAKTVAENGGRTRART